MKGTQPGILTDVPPAGRFLTFDLRSQADPSRACARLAEAALDPHTVIGIGEPVARGRIPGLRPFPDLGLFPSTQGALWAFLLHADRGEAFDRGMSLADLLGDAFHLAEEIDGFKYRGGRDLSGFEDGTENPKGEAAVAAAIATGRGPGLDGGSFVAVQRWVHDLRAIGSMSATVKEAVVGRRLETNEELTDAPASAHVKRAAQESYDPPAFILRRSMPWGGVTEHGLMFVAYGESLDRFERILRRMAGRDDGTVDGLLSYSRALTGGYYFCPPLREGRLDLSAIGL